MTGRWVVDASVAAKWLAPETDSEQALALLDDHLVVPDLLFPEVANILWKKYLRGEMEASIAAVAARSLGHAPLHVHACAELLDEALELSLLLRHPAYDCFYLALARREGICMVTADRRLVDICRRSDAGPLRKNVVLLSEAGVSDPS
jgi:predicted nucleic acid-binding protein